MRKSAIWHAAATAQQLQRIRERPPMFGAMRFRGWRNAVGQERAGAGAGETEPAPHSGELEQRVVTRIGPRGNSELKMPRAQGASRGAQLGPRPAVQTVFAGESRPRRGERHKFDRGGETREQGRGVRLRDEGHA